MCSDTRGEQRFRSVVKDPTCPVPNLKGARQMKQRFVGRQQMASLTGKLSAPKLDSALASATATLHHVILPKGTFLTLPHQGSHLETLCDSSQWSCAYTGQVRPCEFPSGFPLLVNTGAILPAFQAHSFQHGAIFAHPFFIRIHRNT